jgi:hypothetical protein
MILLVSMNDAIAERRIRAIGCDSIELVCVDIFWILVLKRSFHFFIK